jgi:hypothetical protein
MKQTVNKSELQVGAMLAKSHPKNSTNFKMLGISLQNGVISFKLITPDEIKVFPTLDKAILAYNEYNEYE